MQTSPPPEPVALPRSKALVFGAIAIALPLFALLLVEGALRLAGAAEARRAPFQPAPDHPEAVVLSPDFGAQFFRGFRPGVAFDPLLVGKPAGGLRVVALGGSTTASFPYTFPYGFPARLEDRLAAMLPGQPVEVANLGMTATNSYTLWALAEPVAELRPDAVVIYSGQNEFYGAYGTGGTQGWTGTSIPLKRFLIRAGQWSTVAGLSGLLGRGEDDAGESRTMMARVVREAAIDRDSETYRAGIAQYEANLRDALQTFTEAGIPVFLSTLTSNLADQPPLGDEPEATEAYERGRRLLAAGDTAAARAAFLDAKEADGLRFRAPEALNDVVRRLADAFPNVTLVDAQARFRDAGGGLEDATLFADHLHPNARGYALLADAFADALRQTLPALGEAEDPGPAPSAIDPVEEGVARLQLTVLTSGYPFRKDRTPEQAADAARAEAQRMRAAGGADALAARVALDDLPIMNALDLAGQQARAEGDTLAALRLYGGLLHWQPFNESLMAQAVSYALANPAYDDETAILGRYATTHARDAFSYNALAAVALRRGDLDGADALLDAAERVAPDSPEMLFNRARLLVLRGDTARARVYFGRYQAAAGQ
ncbi:GDSL-type esterase/lipase family protein [Rubrivirga marina]|uniref:SGNH hydrolase-type esterase domain-containing protein n=1 Tax=Rubrivirga marina TaxID=1196024 RepID=A0A271J0V1_9BACT|nr:GDSL-type esterase/lipase family protein [Rubrivirga marina]PAP77126.1 hypothetical protein BSZ37_12160 [Rubrivirga marina]